MKRFISILISVFSIILFVLTPCSAVDIDLSNSTMEPIDSNTIRLGNVYVLGHPELEGSSFFAIIDWNPSTNSFVVVNAGEELLAGGMPTSRNPIIIDKTNREIRIAAEINAKYKTEGSWHLVAYKLGTNGDRCLFRAHAPQMRFYDALIEIAAKPGDNMSRGTGLDAAPAEDWKTTFVEGDVLDVWVTWVGAPKTYHLNEVITEVTPPGSEKRGLEIRFGGNRGTSEHNGTGCITCLYSCPTGITSNAKANRAIWEDDEAKGIVGRFRGNDLLPPDGTQVVLIYKLMPEKKE